MVSGERNRADHGGDAVPIPRDADAAAANNFLSQPGPEAGGGFDGNWVDGGDSCTWSHQKWCAAVQHCVHLDLRLCGMLNR